MELPQFAPPPVSLPDLGASSVPPFEGLGLKGLILEANEWESAAWNGIVDAFSYVGDAVREAADAVAADIEQLGNWLGNVTGVEMLSDGASFAAGIIRDSGNLVGAMVASVPHGVAAVHDYVSNMSTGDVLDVAQGALDVAGLVPVVGEFADGANALSHLARANYVDAGLSTTAMLPLVGDTIGKGRLLRRRHSGAKRSQSCLFKCRTIVLNCSLTFSWIASAILNN